jgi:hypothetical protein
MLILGFAALVVLALMVLAAHRLLVLAVAGAFWLWVWWFGVEATSELDNVPMNVVVDGTGQPVRLPPQRGGGVGGDRHAPISAFLAGARLRPRARWARGLEVVLGVRRGTLGAIVRGRWTPDLPSAANPACLNLVLSQFEDGAILLGGGEVQCKDGERATYYVVELSDGSRNVLFPELLSRLGSYALLRQRDAVLVSALRLRALEWCKSKGISDTLRLLIVPSVLRCVFEKSPEEIRLEDSLSLLSEQSPRWFQRA